MGAPVSWFEIGTADPEGAERFYGKLFGWSFRLDPDAGMPYTLVTTREDAPIGGGIFPTGGAVPNYAVFCILVDDVAATCERAEELGGKVLVPTTTMSNGLAFAHLLDGDGNHFGIFSPPPQP